ncbi:hypothetical protein SAMN02745168_1392 [Papillibacter cinnamivorans DSM 12816]|uniref:Uncharacterized protein n=1 Tax=Papillibacter cinnamivorans DSM 12816 TaxID=1122930 RepID=A0A1W2A1Z9_9FIRM|nr:hypothetical protein SAMN02745168_1392 [Papillibacter cinnamivorans DSM 12816]
MACSFFLGSAPFVRRARRRAFVYRVVSILFGPQNTCTGSRLKTGRLFILLYLVSFFSGI